MEGWRGLVTGMVDGLGRRVEAPKSSKLAEVRMEGKHSRGCQLDFLGMPPPPDRQASEPSLGSWK